MQQLSIDAYEAAPRARRRDPITSHLAAEQAKELRQRLIRLTGKTVMSTAGRAEREWAAA